MSSVELASFLGEKRRNQDDPREQCEGQNIYMNSTTPIALSSRATQRASYTTVGDTLPHVTTTVLL